MFLNTTLVLVPHYPQQTFTCSNSTIEIPEKRCEIHAKLAIKKPERRHYRHSGVFIVNFEQISHIFLVFLSLTLSMYLFAGLKVHSYKQAKKLPPQS